MSVPIGRAISVEKHPVSAAAIPAICPIGSIVIEFKFPNNTLVQKRLLIQNAIKVQSGGVPLKYRQSGRKTAETTQKIIIARRLKNLIPNFITSLAFIMEAAPKDKALIAKYIGKSSPAL